MQKIDLFLFDLDGTLIDSKRDIANSVNYTMKKIGLAPLPDEQIYDFVGLGVTPLIRQSIEAAGGINFDEALKIFMTHYDGHLLDHTKPFEGVLEILKYFQDKPMIVLTNKSQRFSEKVLRGLNLDKSFAGIYGGDTEFPKKPDPKVVHHLLKKFQVAPEKTVIVGDSRIDMETGQNAGILRCGATYGFRPREELTESGCDELIEKPQDLIQLFC